MGPLPSSLPQIVKISRRLLLCTVRLFPGSRSRAAGVAAWLHDRGFRRLEASLQGLGLFLQLSKLDGGSRPAPFFSPVCVVQGGWRRRATGRRMPPPGGAGRAEEYGARVRSAVTAARWLRIPATRRVQWDVTHCIGSRIAANPLNPLKRKRAACIDAARHRYGVQQGYISSGYVPLRSSKYLQSLSRPSVTRDRLWLACA